VVPPNSIGARIPHGRSWKSIASSTVAPAWTVNASVYSYTSLCAEETCWSGDHPTSTLLRTESISSDTSTSAMDRSAVTSRSGSGGVWVGVT
jgi:hypothetical protein